MYTLQLRKASVLISVPLSHEPVVQEKPIPPGQRTGPVQHPNYHSYPFLSFSWNPLIDQPEKESEELSKLHSDSPGTHST